MRPHMYEYVNVIIFKNNVYGNKGAAHNAVSMIAAYNTRKF